MKKVLSFLLICVLPLGMLLTTALAVEVEENHAYDGWTAVAMDTDDPTKLNVGGTVAATNTLTAGNYYLDGDLMLSRPLHIGNGSSGSGTVTLCLNGHSITNSGGNSDSSNGAAIYLNNYAELTLEDDSTTPGTVTGHSYGIYVNDSGVLSISGGSVTGDTYGVYNNYTNRNNIYLSGSPSITGTEADIYNNSYSSRIYADDGADGTAVPYSGKPVLLAYRSFRHEEIAVLHVTEDTKELFTLTGPDKSDNYELILTEGALQIQGKPQSLTWYDINDVQLIGDSYLTDWPYGTQLYDYDLPDAPAVEGKTFLGWLYKDSGDGWSSSSYWPGDYIYQAMDFKADYMDSSAGSGTERDPYRIADAADLQRLAAVVNSGNTAYNDRNVWYKLTADIDLSAVCGEGKGDWTPIGGDFNPFIANFDGDGKTVSNLYINNDKRYQGLFGALERATVKNLTLTGSVSIREYSGALAGEIYDSTVENVDVTGVVFTPYGYTTDENRTMAYRVKDNGYGDSHSINIRSNYRNNWIQTTYNDGGYKAVSADLNDAAVSASARLINGGRYVQLSYTVTAGSDPVANGKLAIHADIEVGDNDEAAVEVIQDARGKVIGLKMVDTHTNVKDCPSENAQFNLYFDGTGGVTPADTYWFGKFTDREDHCYDQLDDNTKTSSDGTYTQDGSGVYTKFSGADSGFAISWQNITLATGESKTYSFVMGVGEKADPPQWSDEQDVSLTLSAENGRLIKVTARVKDAAGLTDTLYHSVDGGEGEALGSVEADGSTMKDITGWLDLSGYEPGDYVFSFWVVNSKGAASSSVERTITITANGTAGLGSASGKVEVKGDAPEVTTDRTVLKELAGEINEGDIVTVTLTVEKQDAPADKDAIVAVAQGKKVELYLDLSLVKTTVHKGSTTSDSITDTGDKVLEIVVPFDFTGKKNVTVYRKHGTNDAEALTEAATGVEGTFRLDQANKRICIYASKFSTYAVGYTKKSSAPSLPSSGGTPATYAVQVLEGIPNGGVSASHKSAGRGTIVTVTVAPDEGYETDRVTVLDMDGKEVPVTDKGDGKYTFTMPGGKVTVDAGFVKMRSGYAACPKDDTCPLTAFTDTSVTKWYHDGVHYCVENGLMDGYGKSLFGPNDILTRAQFVQILFNKEGKPAADKQDDFSDVDEGAWYDEAVCWAADQGIVKGYRNGKFGSNEDITREQIAVILYRYFGSPASNGNLDAFADADKAGGYALEALRWAVEQGILHGKSKGSGVLDPTGRATRAEAAAMLQRFCELTGR